MNPGGVELNADLKPARNPDYSGLDARIRLYKMTDSNQTLLVEVL